MPSALETLVKILKLEREQGYRNTAVIGGLGAFCEKWTQDARAQARKPEHHLLVDELSELLRNYEAIENRNERHNTVVYMIDRITGRKPAPPAFQVPPENQPAAQGERREISTESKTERNHRIARREEKRRESPRREERQSAGRTEDRPARKERVSESGRKPVRPARFSSDEVEDDASDYMGFDYDSGPSRSGPVVMDIPVKPRLARPPRRPRPYIDPERAADILHGLRASVDKMKGIGPNKAATLSKVGIETINDLLFYLPRRYDDYTQMLPIRRLQPKMQVAVIGTVKSADVRIGKNNRKDFAIVVDDGSAMMNVIFFGQGQWLGRSIKPGMQIVLRGVTEIYGNRIQMVNPEWEAVDPDNLQQTGIVPVYPLTEGLKASAIRQYTRAAVDYWADRLPDYMPEAVLERADLADLGWMIRNLHFPETWDHLYHAKRRFIFDQLMILQLAVLANRRVWQSVPSAPLSVSDEWLEAFLTSVFPYELTGAQKRAIEDIRGDIAKEVPMNRLLQGDVGSGKTAIALTAVAMAFASGKQAALMAPTSILAEQHYRNIDKQLAGIPGERRPVVALLTGSITSSERESIYRGLADGSIDIAIGTHALIQENVEFKDLGLVVIDEQHRFGVEQRGALRGKGTNPHLLVMTATPIPRTLALTLYADLDLSVIDEMPPGRIPIQTRVIEPNGRERAYNFVEGQLELGRQAFIVYPLVEASDKIEAESAVEAYDKLQKIFYEYKVGLLHGRMTPREKDDIMAAFRDKVFDVLVTTSVAEVGVDIPNASVIMIEGANRFGLAQLHQFRGRVGRGGHASYCLLVCDTPLPEARERLEALEQFNDGFKLAEIDWRLRGPGDLVGTRQSGQGLIQLVDDMSPELVALAQREARTLYEEDPELLREEHRLLRERVAQLRNDRSDLS